MQNDGEVGVLQQLSLEVFDHEAYDFTTWLGENIGVPSNSSRTP
jgi:hypothetical protein